MNHRATSYLRRAIALIGLSGAGKSTVGRRLAAHLGWPLRDTDALVALAAGRSVPQIFAEQGEARFRQLETAALRRALNAAPCVVATGGGIVLAEANRALLRARAFVIWLDAPTELLVARLQSSAEARPLLAGDATARLEALRAARAPLYAALANLRVETAGRTVEEVEDEVLQSVKATLDHYGNM